MKATELQCYDLVNVDDKPVMIYGTMARLDRVYDTMTNDISAKRCSPIPLTAEILEKNEWEHAYEKNALGELHKWHKEVRFQQFTVWKNKGRFELGNLGNHPFRFVHELQHALRLCGLNDLADNFKV